MYTVTLTVNFDPSSYKSRHQAEFFGRGNLAGIDIRVQKKNKSRFYQDLMEERRTDDQKKQAE